MKQLCGFRKNGNPNTSDNNDSLSKAIAFEMFEVLGVPAAQPEPPDAGAGLEQRIRDELAHMRPDLEIERSRAATDFSQYAHLAVFPKFRKARSAAVTHLDRINGVVPSLSVAREQALIRSEIDRARQALEVQDALAEELIAQMPEEALLKVDLTVAEPRPGHLPQLHLAISSKWSLRTDRAQDCVSQGAKLVGQRRGRMPHFAVVTVEPRSTMLKILADGSGAIDCVYHLDLPALTEAWDRLAASRGHSANWSPYRTFKRLLDQGRLRDYDDLLAEVRRVPSPQAVAAPDPTSP